MRCILLFIWIITVCPFYGQQKLRVLFWNTENLFDYRNDTLKKDDEFLPEAPRHWTFYRYRHKLIQLSKVIVAAGEGELPALIGLCEVENDSVLQDLQRLTPLRQLGYRAFITHSPDERGINIAFLYQRNRFRLLHSRSHRIIIPLPLRPTRDILQVTGLISPKDTLDMLICHFPSRSGGEITTRPARKAAYQKLRLVADSLLSRRLHPNLLIMGDFNDTPHSTLQKEVLQCFQTEDFPQNPKLFSAQKQQKDEQSPCDSTQHATMSSFVSEQTLYNLMSSLPPQQGSYKYDGRWEYIDQFLINGGLLQESSWHLSNCRIFSPDFLQTEDTKSFGKRPFRTYYGYRYEGGFSDHFPILLDLIKK